MAGILLLIDADETRRRVALSAGSRWLSPNPAALIQERGDGPLQLRWAAGDGEPFSHHVDSDGSSTLLWGDMLDADGPVHAGDLARRVQRQPELAALELMGGLHAWVRFRDPAEVVVGSDAFHSYPLFYFGVGGVFGLSTNPKALMSHPSLTRATDPIGVARHLIGNGSAGERTLLRDLRRLAPRTVLRVDADGRVSLHLQRAFRRVVPPTARSLGDAVATAEELLETAVRRHATGPCQADALLLSGGLDSRLLAYCMSRLGERPTCLIFGERGDFETTFGEQSARTLGLPYEPTPDAHGALLESARTELDFVGPHSGFSAITSWQIPPVLGRHGTRHSSGLYLGTTLCPLLPNKPSDRRPGTFEHDYDVWANSLGMEAESLRRIARPGDLRDAVDAAIDEIRAEWTSFGADPVLRRVLSMLHHRCYHLLGGIIWKNSFYSWPSTPALDLPLFEGLLGFDPAHYESRRLERSMLAAASPRLARIPLADGSNDPRPIVSSPRDSVSRSARRLMGRLGMAPGRRRYARLLDLNHLDWRPVREEAARGLEAVHDWFDPEALRRYLPSPDEPIPMKRADPVLEHGGRRALIGLILWRYWNLEG